MPIRSLFIKGLGKQGVALVPLLLSALVVAGEPLIQVPVDQGQRVRVCAPQVLDSVKAKVARLQETAGVMRGLSSQPVPKGLGYEEAREAHRYSLWLQEANERIDRISSKGVRILKYCDRSRREGATAQMQEMQRSFHAQFLQLQNSLSHEHRQFSMVSNIMKNRHDTAKKSINNIR